MSKISREEQIFNIGGNVSNKAYRLGLEDFHALIERLESMKKNGFIEKYSFEAYNLWVVTKRVITREQWNLGLDDVNKMLDELTPQMQEITAKNIQDIEKGDCILLKNGIKTYFSRWSWLDGDYAVLVGLRKTHKDMLIGATRIPKHLEEAGNEQDRD